MTPISATPGTEAQATFEPDFEEPDFEEPADDEDEPADPFDPPELDDDDDDEPFDEPDEDEDDESPDDADAPAFSVFLSPEPEPDPEPDSDPDLASEDAAELESAPVSDLSLVLPLRESVR
jgi:hypothetical protein